jgi:hypothetical protein
MAPDEFARGYLNRWTSANDRVISDAAWRAVLADTEPVPPLCIGVDISPDRDFAAIAMADTNGRAELGAYNGGVAWVGPRVIELAKRHNAPVALFATSQASTLIHELEQARVRLVKISGRETASACGSLYDAIVNGTLAVSDSVAVEPLDIAVAAARKHTYGGGFTWVSNGPDITPLYALTAAAWGASRTPEKRRPGLAWL